MGNKFPIISNDRIPNLEFFKAAFQKMEQPPKGKYDEMIKLYLDALDSYPGIPLNIPRQGSSQKLSAYRVISEKEFIRIGLKSNELTSYSHPPANPQACRPQRFNIEGFPVLYAASNEHTAIEEKYDGINLSEGDAFYISKWELKKEIPFAYIMLFYGNTIDEDYRDIYEAMDRRFESAFGQYTEDKRAALKYYLRKLTDLSLVDKFNDLTSALGHYYLYKVSSKIQPIIGYIGYPSVKKRKSGLNFAINRKLI